MEGQGRAGQGRVGELVRVEGVWKGREGKGGEEGSGVG